MFYSYGTDKEEPLSFKGFIIMLLILETPVLICWLLWRLING
jgi:hypothetical protein